MKDSTSYDYDRLSGFLRAVSLRLQVFAAFELLLLLSSSFLLALLGSFFAFEFQGIFPYLPFLYSLGVISFSTFLIVKGLRRVFPAPSSPWVAKRLEGRFPQFRDDVTNSLLLFPQLQEGTGPGRMSAGLIIAQIKKTAEQVSSLSPSEVISFKRVSRHLRLLIPLLTAFSAVLALDPPFLARSLALVTNPLSALPAWETRISLDPKGSVVLRGTSLKIRAQATGTIPERIALAIWPEEGSDMRVPMIREGEGKFTYQILSAQSSFRYQAYNGQSASPMYSLRVVDAPEIIKLKLTLTPPEYARLPKETRDSGHIEALKGTAVNLEGDVNKAVVAAEVVLNQETPLALELRGEAFHGSLLVWDPGHYSFKMRDEFGFENPNPVQYSIRLIPDKPPEAEILQPGKDLEIIGGEEVPIVYTARDDFGLSAVKLLYQLGGREYSFDLKKPNGERALLPQAFKWEMSNLALTPGEKIVYRLGVWDNDAISGPKVGYSRSFTISILDERSKAAREGEEAQQISEALLSLLADHLEEAKDREGLAKRMEEILKRLDRNLERMGERRDRFDFDALRRNLSSLKERIPFETRENVTQEMERLALLAEEMAKQVRMSELEAMARELRNRHQRLLDSLKDWKGNLTREALEAALKELQKLSELLRSIMEAMTKLAPQLPDEFINNPELSGLDFQDLFSDLEEIQRKLLAGDLAGALEAAQKLLQSISEMMAALSRAGSQAARAQSNRLQGEMSRQSGELEKLLAEQKEILRETERIDRELRDKILEEAEKRRKLSQPRMEEALEQLKQFLPGEQRDEVSGWEKLLQEGKMEKFAEEIRERAKEPGPNPEVQKLLEEIKKMVEGMRPDSREVMDPDQKGKFPSLSSRQEKLKERTQDLKEKLEMLSQLFPGLDNEILKDLEGAGDSMGEASGKLRGEDAPGAIPPEQEVLRRLNRSQQAMRQMGQQMAMRGQINRWGRPWGYDPRPGWYYGPWSPMPTLPQPEVKRPLERGYTGIDREEFEPPSKDAYQVPKIFREKILEALKENVPSPYKREVEKYFRGLSE